MVADIHFIYSYCNENASEYRRRVLFGRIPKRNMFSKVHRHLMETATFRKATAEIQIEQEPVQK